MSEARAGSLGPFSPSFNIQNVLLEGMQKYLPLDVHKIVSGKLHISLTRVYDGENVIVSEFATREDLLQVCVISLQILTRTHVINSSQEFLIMISFLEKQ